MRKPIILLGALAVGFMAMVVANQWLKASTDQSVAMAEIFVATVAIDIGEEIKPEKIRLEPWPADKVPNGSTGDLATLEGKYAKQRFYAGEPLMAVKLMDENWTTVPTGYRVVAMPASSTNIANLVQPGDRVDVLAYFKQGGLIPQSLTKTVLMGVRVYALDGDTERRGTDDRPKNFSNIQLLIHEKDTSAWTYANELGRIRLSLGSDADYKNEDGSNEAGQKFLAWVEELQAAENAARDSRKNFSPLPTTSQDAAAVAAADEPDPKTEGFIMRKHVEGRVQEYYIVPGKLPVLVGEAGESGEAGDIIDDSPSIGPQEDAASYLNGDGSPFYTPVKGKNRSGADSLVSPSTP